MAKLPKVAQKLFGSGAGFHQIIKFGSLFAGATAYTTDIAEMMGLSNWQTGWYAAAIGGNAPTIQDMNAVHTVLSYQLGYIMQQGVPEWDAATVYYIGSIVNNAGVLYTSLVEDNTANAVSDSTKWKPFSSEFTGNGKDHWLSSLPQGWIWANGGTIGNASSNATNRANVDTFALFAALWADYSNTLLRIYDSAGIAAVRGANALADWNANKALSVIDKRGRVSVGKDNMGGVTAAGRMTATTLSPDGNTIGANGGEQTHQLSTGEIPSHTHTQDAHRHIGGQLYQDNWGAQLYGQTPVLGSGTYGQPNAGSGNFVGLYASTETATNQNTGGGGAHNNVQPTIVCNYIIKL